MILCCGEALIDMLPVETRDGARAFQPHSGGAVFNTAIALGRLEQSTGFLSGLSTDMFGDQLRESLAQSGVSHDLSILCDLPTTLAFVTLTDGQARYAFNDENTAGRMLSVADLPDIPPAATAMFFGGISLPTEPCGSAYEALALREAQNRVIMIDPNIRRDFIRDETAYRARLDRMITASDIVKLSDEDLDWLVPQGSGLKNKARAVLDQGPSLVVVTMGAEGAFGLTRDGVQSSAGGRPAKVVDTVGAGDSFNAGILAGLQSRGLLNKPAIGAIGAEALTEILAFSCAIAAVTVSRAGANPPHLSELNLHG